MGRGHANEEFSQTDALRQAKRNAIRPLDRAGHIHTATHLQALSDPAGPPACRSARTCGAHYRHLEVLHRDEEHVVERQSVTTESRAPVADTTKCARPGCRIGP